jgi:hypothetical protein
MTQAIFRMTQAIFRMTQAIFRMTQAIFRMLFYFVEIVITITFETASVLEACYCMCVEVRKKYEAGIRRQNNKKKLFKSPPSYVQLKSKSKDYCIRDIQPDNPAFFDIRYLAGYRL